MIVILGLLLNFGMYFRVFLVLKPMPLLHFTLRVMGKVNALIARLNKSHIPTFIKKLLSPWLDALPFTEFII